MIDFKIQGRLEVGKHCQSSVSSPKVVDCKLKPETAKLIDSPAERSMIVDHLAFCNLEYQAIRRDTAALRRLQRTANRRMYRHRVWDV